MNFVFLKKLYIFAIIKQKLLMFLSMGTSKTHNSRLATKTKAEFTNVNEHFVEGA